MIKETKNKRFILVHLKNDYVHTAERFYWGVSKNGWEQVLTMIPMIKYNNLIPKDRLGNQVYLNL